MRREKEGGGDEVGSVVGKGSSVVSETGSRRRQYQSQNKLIMSDLRRYFLQGGETADGKPNHRLLKVISIMSGASGIPFRILDWFVTNYAKQYGTAYVIQDPTRRSSKYFKVHSEFQLALSAFRKERVDPFGRGSRILLQCPDGKVIETTLSQLNFFKWAMQNNVIQYVEDHYEEIDRDMKLRNPTSNKRKGAGAAGAPEGAEGAKEAVTGAEGAVAPAPAPAPAPATEGARQSEAKKKRRELSQSSAQFIKKQANVNIVVCFE